MRKPSQILKSTIASNAALVRERQWFVDYLYALYNSMRKITQDGKDSGVVDLAELDKICREIGAVVNVYDRKNAITTGVMKPPKNAKELGENTEMNKITGEYAKDMNETLPGVDNFIQKIINDILKMQPPPKEGSEQPEKKSDNQDPTWGEWKFFSMPQHDTFKTPPKEHPEDTGFGTYGLFDDPPFDSPPPPPPRKKKPKKDVDNDAE